MKPLKEFISEAFVLPQGDFKIKYGEDFPINITIGSKVFIKHTSRWSDDFIDFELSKKDFTNLLKSIQDQKQYSVWLNPSSKDRKFFDHVIVRYEPSSNRVTIAKYPKDKKNYAIKELKFNADSLKEFINKIQ